MLRDPLADVGAGDEQHRLGAVEGRLERRRVVVVDRGGAEPVDEDLGPSRGRDHLAGGQPAGDEVLDDETTELAGGTGDDDGHGWFLSKALLVVCPNRPPTFHLPRRA